MSWRPGQLSATSPRRLLSRAKAAGGGEGWELYWKGWSGGGFRAKASFLIRGWKDGGGGSCPGSARTEGVGATLQVIVTCC